MSSALVRQALELVDPEERVRGRSKKTKRPALGQEHSHPYKSKSKIKKPEIPQKTGVQIAEENIRKLLALSKPTADPNITKKIIQRVTGCKPLVNTPVEKKDDGKSILFPEDEGDSTLFPDEGQSNLSPEEGKSIQS